MRNDKDNENAPELSRSSVERLYSYYLIFQRMQQQGEQYVSSGQLAENLLIGDTQVRKDMAAIQLTGQPKRGYEATSAMDALRETMGLDQVQRAVLCGVGNLGSALLEYSRFNEFGFRIVGAFDIREDVIGQDVGGMRVLPIEHLDSVIEIYAVEIGILTVNVWSAQELADQMVEQGIKAIWNFAPIHLNVSDHVMIQHEDFAGSLSVISYYLKNDQSKSEST